MSRRKSTSAVFYLLFAAFSSFSSTSILAAALNVDIVNPVCSDASDGVTVPFCNIQPAVDFAIPGDVVNIAPGIYGDSNKGAPSVIEIYKDIQLQGAGTGQTVIDGGGLINGIFIHDMVNVSISGVSITNGRSVQGAGVHNRGQLTLADSELVGNTADHGGGGIFNADVPGTTSTLERVWIHNNFAQSIFSDVTASGGGGVYNLGSMQIIESRIENNFADNIGGGILNEKSQLGLSDLKVISSSIKFNDARHSGGVSNHGKLYIENSTIANNTAIRDPNSSGGGISSVLDSELTMVNSTVSGNAATLRGGGIQKKNAANVVLHNVTVSQNSVGQPNRSGAALGGGIYAVNLPNVRMTHSILAGNNTTEGGPDCYRSIESIGFNFIGVDKGCSNIVAIGDIVGFGFPIDPMLAPLKDNGGPTETHALLLGSPAIDAGDSAGCPDTTFTQPLLVDQRGAPRPPLNGPSASPVCDMGSFEFGSVAPSGGGSGGGDPDSDGDGIPDSWEQLYGFNPNDPNDALLDIDGDGLSNLDEFLAGTNPLSEDSDRDNMPDGWEVQYNLNPLDESDAWIDSDSDGLLNVDEAALGSNPNNADSDGDGIPDLSEAQTNLNPTDPTDAALDFDGDGLSNLEEFQAGTNPQLLDTDGDTLSDGDEINQGLNPLHQDSDNDGLADNLEPGLALDPLNPDTDADGTIDGFEAGHVIRASITHDGKLIGFTNDGNSGAAMSGDGRYVAFVSDASDLVPGDSNDTYDVFVRDTIAGTTTRVSVASDGTQGNNWSGRLVNGIGLSMSEDARYIAFHSAASNLVAGDTNGSADVFVHDRQTGVTERVSVTSAGDQLTGFNAYPSISADGRYVAFSSNASTLLSGPDANSFWSDIFVHDRINKTTTHVSRNDAGEQANHDSESPVISADGRYITYSSQATNLIANDNNGVGYSGKDVFIFDIQTKLTKRISVASDGSEGNNNSGGHDSVSISGDGRFVAFVSNANNLVAADNNSRPDIFVHDTQSGETTRVSVATGGEEAFDYSVYPAISADGRFVAFMSKSRNLAAVDPTVGSEDVFMHDRLTGETHILSVNNAGEHNFYINAGRYGLTISPDGKYVAFRASTGELSPGDGRSRSDIFIAKRPEGVPQVSILSPANGGVIAEGSLVTFQASAFDAEDGDMTAIIQWNSSIDGVLGIGTGFTGVLSPGSHVLSTTVTDSSGRVGSSQSIVSVNELPQLSVLGPIGNSRFNEGVSVTFTASAFDGEDGNLDSVIQWSSSIDGLLGSGSGFTYSLSPGRHIITASVTDSVGSIVTVTVSVTINSAPTLTIQAPTEGSQFSSSASILFQASASDIEDGNIGAAIEWVSSRDGIIGTGATFNRTLTSGAHIITATITDADGVTSTKSVNLTVNTPPLLSMSTPVDGLQVNEGEVIVFEAFANDAEDGDLSGNVQWSSNIDGSLGAGGRFLSSLSVGSHMVTASVSDSQGESVSITRSVVVNAKPTIAINSPSGSPIVTSGLSVSLQATASDTEDGDLSSSVQWSSNLDGPLGVGNVNPVLTAGVHTLTATVSDSAGSTSSTSINITINVAPSINIVSPLDGFLVNQPVSIVFAANALDVEDGDISANIQWTSSIDGSLGSGPQIVKWLTPGLHVVTAVIVDSNGASHQSTVNVKVNTVPNVTISFLLNSYVRYTENDEVVFTGTASDFEDGILPVSWKSDIDGDLGTYNVLQTKLSPGLHTITGLANDSNGGGGSDSIMLQIYGVPKISIGSPINGTIIQQGQILPLIASASDSEDGDTTASIQWISNIDGALGAGGTASVMLSAGTHLLTANVTDSDGFSASASTNVIVNAAPQILMTAPSDGSQFVEGSVVTLQATASDNEDGDVTSAITWSSSIDGAIGTGGNNNMILSVGTHTITATVTDSYGIASSMSVTLVVNANVAPQVSLLSPTNGSAFVEGSVVALNATASDNEDGDLTAGITWVSNIDGAIGTGGNSTNVILSVGTHTITATVTDRHGLPSSVTTTVVVNANVAPQVSLLSPTNGTSFIEGAVVTLNATASDNEDGDLTTDIIWSSSIDGAIGTGGNSTNVILSVGMHTITATVTDRHGLPSSVTTTVVVNANVAPQVSLLSPTNGAAFVEGSVVTLNATASDNEDGDLTAAIAWNSSIDGAIGTGGNSINVILSVGAHTITATVTDSHGVASSMSVTVVVNANVAPQVILLSPTNGSAFVEGSVVTLNATASDNEDGDLTAGITWTSNIDGALGTGGNSTNVILSVGTHTITATVTDSHGLNSSVAATVVVEAAPPVNVAPTADAGSDQEVGSRDRVYLDGSASSDSDGNIVSYRWTQVSGRSRTLNNSDEAVADLRAPRLRRGRTYTLVFELEVTDDQGVTSTDQVTVEVR